MSTLDNRFRNVIDSDLSVDQKVDACISHAGEELQRQRDEIVNNLADEKFTVLDNMVELNEWHKGYNQAIDDIVQTLDNHENN